MSNWYWSSQDEFDSFGESAEKIERDCAFCPISNGPVTYANAAVLDMTLKISTSCNTDNSKDNPVDNVFFV